MEVDKPKNSEVYVISLDAIDLNFLQTMYNTGSDKITPFWSQSSLERRNDEYYQFEIKNKDSEESSEDEMSKLEFENVICYICDIDVPKPFFSEHKKSVRHKTNVQIADVAINRMKRHSSTDDKYNADEVHPSMYFCPICVTVIDCNDITSHNKSLSHKNAMVIEKIFNDFLMLYQSNDKTDNGSNEQHTNINDLEIEHGIADNTLNLNNISIEEDHLLQKVVNCEKETSNPSKQLINAIENPTTQKDKIVNIAGSKDVDYFCMLNERLQQPMSFIVLPENIIEIQTLDGSVVQVNETQFHGFYDIGRRHIKCFVCKEIYKKTIIESHKLSETHINNVLLPLKDKHCARQIDDIYSHCVICNEITENSDLHSLCNKKHYDLLKDALVYDNFDKNKTVHEQLNDAVSILSKVKNTVVNNTNKDETKKSEGILTRNEHDLLTTKKDNEPTQNTVKSVKVNEKRNTKILSNEYFCDVCNEYVSEFRRIKHNASPKHILNNKSNVHYLMTEEDADTLVCRVCEITVTNNVDNAQSHASSNDHIEKYNQLLMHNNIEKVSSEIFYCEVCNEILVFKNEIFHIKLKRHSSKLAVDQSEAFDTVTHQEKFDTVNYTESFGSVNHQETDTVNHQEKFDTVNRQESFDTLNHRETLGSLNHYKTDIVNHREKFDTINHPERFDAVNHYKTDTINHREKFDIGNHQRTLDTVNHQLKTDIVEGVSEDRKVSNGESKKVCCDYFYCKVCDVKVPNSCHNISEHKKGKVHFRNLEKHSNVATDTIKTDKKIHYHMEHSKDPNKLNCRICNVLIPLNESCISLHLVDTKHVANYKKLLKKNYLYSTGDNIYCEVCTVYVGINNDLAHISGRNHNNNFEKRQSELARIDILVLVEENKNIMAQEDHNLVKPCTSKSELEVKRQFKPERLGFLKASDNSNEVICKICNVRITYSEDNVRIHINGEKHKSAHNQLFDKWT